MSAGRHAAYKLLPSRLFTEESKRPLVMLVVGLPKQVMWSSGAAVAVTLRGVLEGGIPHRRVERRRQASPMLRDPLSYVFAQKCLSSASLHEKDIFYSSMGARCPG